MAEIKKISTELQLLDKFLDTSGDAGTSGQVLTSTGTGINWVSGGSLPGGPYLPLSAGSSYPLTGDLYIAKAANQGQLFFGTANANYEIFGGGFWGYMGYNTNGYHRFLIQGSEKMRINSSGDVLMGNTVVNPASGFSNQKGLGYNSTTGQTQIASTDDVSTLVLGRNNATDGSLLEFRKQSTVIGNFGSNTTGGQVLLDLKANQNFRIVTNNAERMRITSAGNVGIGTASPGTLHGASYGTTRLHVDGGTDRGQMIIEGDSFAGIVLSDNGATANQRVFATSVDDTKYTIKPLNDNGTSTAGGVAVTVLHNGNVGIGATNPLRKLHVVGQLAVNNATTEYYGVLLQGGEGADPSVLIGDWHNSSGTIKWDSSGNYLRIDSQHSTANAAILFSGNDAATEYMRITSGGNVGIGTTSPGTALQVGGLDDGSNYDITVGWNAVSSQAIGTKRSALTFKTSQTGVNNEDIYKWDIAMVTAPATASNEPFGSDLAFLRSTRSSTSVNETTMILTQPGNVGIGVTDPQAKLEVKGASATPADGNEIISVTNTTGGSKLLLGVVENSYGWIQAAEGATLRNLLLNPTGGNVGIGEDAPGTLLSLKSPLANTSIITLKCSKNDSSWTVGDRIGGVNFFGEDGSGQGAGIKGSINYIVTSTSGGSNAMTFNVAGASNNMERMRIDSSGNVGIGGTAQSGFKLDVNGNIIARASAYVLTDLIHYGTSDFNINASNGSTDIKFETGSSERMRINSSGNVGIGTTGPDSPLEIEFAENTGTIKQMLHLDYNPVNNYGSALFKISAGTNSAAVTQIEQVTSGGNGSFGTYQDTNIINRGVGGISAGNINFITGSNTSASSIVMTIGGGSQKGNVGIGTTNPTNKLHVLGSQATVYSSTDTGGQASVGTTINNTNTSGNTNNFSQLLFTVGTNNNSVSRIVAIRSGSDASDLAFVGKSTAGVAEYMRIKSGGNVGIGINNPSALLEVRKGSISGQIAKFSAINPHVVIESSTAGNAVLHLKPNATSSKSGQFKVTAGNGYNFKWTNDASGTGETVYMDLDTSTTGGGDLTVKGDVIAYGSPSDKKYKENIKPIESALDKAMQLQGVTFDWKDSESILEIKEDIGFIAQDVQEVLPELVRDNGKGNLSLRYQGITPILLEAIKELKAEIEELKLNNCNCNK